MNERELGPSGPQERWRRVRESLRRAADRAAAHPAYRPVAVGAGALLAVFVVALLILIFRPGPEPIDGFIARWNAAVEALDEVAYDKLLTEDLLEKNGPAYVRGLEFLRELHHGQKLVQPLETPIETDKILIPVEAEVDEENGTAVLSFVREAGTLRFHLKRGGWARRWYIQDVESVAPVVEQALPKLETPAPQNLPPEVTTPARLEADVPGTTSTTPLDTEFKLRQILEAWRTAWEREEIDAYMAWYADYATIRRVTVVGGREIPEVLTKEQLRARMKRLARKYDKIEVGITNLQIEGNYAEASLRFRQEYTAWRGEGAQAPVYHDIGIKTLKFVNENGEWKIYHEDWSTYVNVPSYPLN